MKKIKMKFGEGVFKAAKGKPVPHLYSNLSLDDLRKSIQQLETEGKIKFDKPMGLHPDTGGMYRLADNCYGNKAMYEEFKRLLMAELNNYSLPKTFLPTSKEE